MIKTTSLFGAPCSIIEYDGIKPATVEDTVFFLLWRCDPTRVMASSFLRFIDIHNDAPQSVELLWKSDHLVAETST